MTKSLPYSIFSVLMPIIVYVIILLAGLLPDRLDHVYVYFPILAAHGFGIFFAAAALAGSNRIPMDISPRMRLTVFFASVGIFLNIVMTEFVLGNTVFHAVVFPPPGS